MSLRELLAVFDIGVNTSQIQNAEAALANLRANVQGAGQAVAGVPQGVKLKADASGMKGAQSVIDSVKGALLGLFAVGGAKAIAGEFEALVNEGSKLNDLSEKLGVGTDSLQQFAYAVGLSGVEADSAYAALGKMSRVVGDALGGGAAAQDFASFGVAIKDASGQARPLIDIAGDMADVVKKSGSEAEAAAKLTKVFGKSGAALIPAFKGGKEELAKLTEEFKALGGGMSSDFVKQADEAGDNIGRLKTVSKQLKITLAAEVLPYVNGAALALIGWYKSARTATKDTDVLRAGLTALGVAGFAYAGSKALESGMSITKALSLGASGVALIAAVALVALLFDDLFGLIKGNESVLGQFLDDTYGLGTAAGFVEELQGAWAELSVAMESPDLQWARDLASDILPAILNHFVRIVRAVAAMAKMIASAVQAVQNLSRIRDTLRDLPSIAADVASGKGLQVTKDGMSDAQGGARVALGNAVDNFGSAFASLARQQGGAGIAKVEPKPQVQEPQAPAAAAGVARTIAPGAVTQQNRITIEVKSPDAATAVAKSVKATLTDGAIDANLRDALEGAY